MQALKSINDLSKHKIPQSSTFVTNGLRILGVLMGFQDFAMHFLDEVLSQDVAHIANLPRL
jgi:hypothetical protein